MSEILDKTIVLSLNALWQPIDCVSVRKAIENMTSGNSGHPSALGMNMEVAEDGSMDILGAVKWEEWVNLPIRHYDLTVMTNRGPIRAPQVIVAPNYDKSCRIVAPRASRRGILERDNYTCQYCGNRFPEKQLNLDHVFPESRGGKSNWQNLVCSCLTCNSLKADRTPQEAGMRLLRQPFAPKPRPASFKFQTPKTPFWAAFTHK